MEKELEIVSLVQELAEQGIIVTIKDAKQNLTDAIACGCRGGGGGNCSGGCGQGGGGGGSGYRPKGDLFENPKSA